MNLVSKLLLHTACGIVCAAPVMISAQVLISDGQASACSGVLYDSSGQGGAGFGPAEDHTLVLCPDDGTNVFLEWFNFELDAASFMIIYDGDDTSAPELGSSWDGSFLDQIFIASSNNPSGCLTIKFVSSANPDAGGIFGARIGCGQPCEAPIPVINQTNPSPLYVCPGELVDFDGIGSVSTGADIATYSWDFNANGVPDIESNSPTAEWTFDTPGIELVQLSLVDAAGCESVQPTNYYVYISTEPDWNTDVVSGACTGEEVSLSIGVDGVPFTLEPGNDFGEAISLPDNVGTCFYSEITVNSFLPGAVLVDAGDGIENFFVNMEHSFLGDLDIAFICPNGQAMTVSSYPGPGTNLGVPVMNDDPPEAGTGYDYYWSSEATLDTWANEVAGPDGSLPSGTYASESSWGTLDGCPLNGTWQLEICDFWRLDNGFVFEWGIDFADTLYPVTQSFTPQFGLECDSTFWTSTNQGEHGVPSGQWNCPDVGVTMSTPGPQTYTAHAINNFGCEYTQEFTVEYVELNALISAPEDICETPPYVLEVLVDGVDPEDLTVVWDANPFLSDTVGVNVEIVGMTEPQTFQANIAQPFVDYPGLVCETTKSVVVGTCGFKIPNVVTLNDDNLNDKFRVVGLESFDDVTMTILNRWGTVVFTSDDFGQTGIWDLNGGEASAGVYYYVLTFPEGSGPLTVTDVNGENLEYAGDSAIVFKGFFTVMSEKDK